MASDNTDAQSCNTQTYCLLNHQIIIGASLSEPHTSLVPGAEEDRLVHTDALPVNYKWRCSRLWGVFSDEIYPYGGPVSENSINILCGYSHHIVLFGKKKTSQERLASRIKCSVGYNVEQ